MGRLKAMVALSLLGSCRQSTNPEELRRSSWGEPSYEVYFNNGRGAGLGRRGACSEDSLSTYAFLYLPEDMEGQIRSALDAGNDKVSVSLYVRDGSSMRLR